jgi:hypothetical protein
MTIYRATAQGISPGGDEFQFGLHLAKAGGTVADALGAFTQFATDLWDGNGGTVVGLTTYYGTSTQLQNLVVTSLDPVTGKNVAQASGAVSFSGTGSGQELPPNTAVCVSTRTGIPTRSGRGRFFLPGPLVSVMLAGSFETSMVADFVAAAAFALTGLVTSTYVPVIFHRTTLTSTPIVSVDVGSVPDVQNRRRNKITEHRQSSPIG